MAKNPDILLASIVTLAEVFTDPQTFVDNDGVVTTKNRQAFAQRQVLNALCYTAEVNIPKVEEKLTKAAAELEEAIAAATEEIGTEEVARKTNWLTTLQGQLALFNRLYETAAQVHEAQLGEKYVPYTQRSKGKGRFASANAKPAEVKSEALAALEAYRASAPKAENVRVN